MCFTCHSINNNILCVDGLQLDNSSYDRQRSVFVHLLGYLLIPGHVGGRSQIDVVVIRHLNHAIGSLRPGITDGQPEVVHVSADVSDFFLSILHCLKLRSLGQSDTQHRVGVCREVVVICLEAVLTRHEARLQPRCFLAHFDTQALRLVAEVSHVMVLVNGQHDVVEIIVVGRLGLPKVEGDGLEAVVLIMVLTISHSVSDCNILAKVLPFIGERQTTYIARHICIIVARC